MDGFGYQACCSRVGSLVLKGSIATAWTVTSPPTHVVIAVAPAADGGTRMRTLRGLSPAWATLSFLGQRPNHLTALTQSPAQPLGTAQSLGAAFPLHIWYR